MTINPSSPSPARRSLLLIGLDLLLVGTLVILPLAWFFDPLQGAWGRVSWGWKPVLAPLGLVLFRHFIQRRLSSTEANARGFSEAPIFRKFCFAWLTTFGFFAGTEAMLALAGVPKMAGVPIVIRGEEDIDTKVKANDNKVIADPELLWRFNPGVQWGSVRINEHGYRTRPFALTKEPGTMRVMVMGDSCTAQGEPPYSDRLHELLQQRPPTSNAWEAFNLGVFGYSIEQGYRQFLKEGPRFKPDVVTLYFGWNDHWLYEKTDRLRLATRMHPLTAKVARAIQEKRLVGLLTQRARKEKPASSSTQKVFRVPPEQYTQILSNFVQAIRDQGAQPVIITAGRRKLTESLVKSGHAEDPVAVEQVHDRYVDLTRQVATSMQVPVLDLAHEFAGPESDAYFSKDGIHFENHGLQVIAERLHAKLAELANTPN